MSDPTELYYAHLEADCNEAEDEYFKARPTLPRTVREELLFRAGFQRAYAKLWPLALVKIDEKASAALEASPAHETSATPDDDRATMIYLSGSPESWRCPDCSANVFTKISEGRYECNGCGEWWRSEGK